MRYLPHVVGMKDKLFKKVDERLKINYSELIDEKKLGKKFYQFKYAYKKAHPSCKSDKKLAYLFLKHIRFDFRTLKAHCDAVDKEFERLNKDFPYQY